MSFSVLKRLFIHLIFKKKIPYSAEMFFFLVVKKKKELKLGAALLSLPLSQRLQ